jgi:hypothetical protein
VPLRFGDICRGSGRFCYKSDLVAGQMQFQAVSGSFCWMSHELPMKFAGQYLEETPD